MRSRIVSPFSLLSVLVILFLGACSAIEAFLNPLPQFPDPTQYTWEPVVLTLDEPVSMAHAGDGSGRIFIVEKEGQIKILVDNEVLPEPFLDIREKVGIQRWEQGFLGLAFHPNFIENGLFFVNYTDLEYNTVIASYSVTEKNPNIANPNSENIVLAVNQLDAEHNGGQIDFGPDGYFYIALGDGGSPGFISSDGEILEGQSLNTFLGKILRVDFTADSLYSSASKNTIIEGENTYEILAYGLRNPWRFSIDPKSGDMYIADVGNTQWEEINFLEATREQSVNFGWSYYQGMHPYFTPIPENLVLEFPVLEYGHEAGRCAIIGGLIYRGKALPAWDGIYFYSDFCSGEIFGLIPKEDGSWEDQLLYDSSIHITSFGLDESGGLYILDREGGVYRLVEISEPN